MLRITGLMIILVAFFIGCGQDQQSEEAQRAVTVTTAPVTMTDFPVTLKIGGTLRGDRQTVIPTKTQTTVSKVMVKRGDAVRRGQLMIMLDPGGVQSQYRQAEAVFLNAQKQYNKMQSLYDAGAISETQLDAAETEFKVAQANFNAARQSIEIEAPFDGVVADVSVHAGDEVAPGMPIVEVADIGSLRLLLQASAMQVSKLKVGQLARVMSSTNSTIVMTGEVYGIADAADKMTRSFETECRFILPPKGFAPGMYVTAEIETGLLESVLVIPNDAILYRTGKAWVYAVDADTAAMVPVTVLAGGEGQSAIDGPLVPDQRVIVVGQKNLTPGTLVREAN